MLNQEKTIKVLKKREVLKNDLALGIAGELTNIEEKVDNIAELLNQSEEVKPEVQKVSLDGISVVTLKGEKGDTPTEEELLALIEPLIPEVEDGKDYVLTEQDKKDIAKTIKVPVVEKVIEKTETIVEQPIVTNEIREVAIVERAEDIVAKINELPTDEDDFKIDAKHIKNLPKQESRPNAIGVSNKYLDQLLDVDLTGVTKTDGKYNLGSGGGSSITLKTDGVDNGSQAILNLKAGTNLNLTDDGLGGITIDAIGDGMGDVTGAASSTNNNVVLFNGTTGKVIKDSGLQLAGSNTGDVTVTDSAEIDFTLTGQNITASLKTGSIDETKLDTSTNTSLGLANTAVQPAGLTNYFNKSVDDTDDITVGATNKFATAAEKTKLGFITVTQAVDLDTIETNANNVPAIKTKTDFITITQAVDLDTIETNSNASKVKTDFITVTQAVDLDTLESDTAINNAKVSNATHTGEVTGSGALTITADAVTNIKLANMAVNTIKGRITAGTGDPEDLTASQVRTITETETTTQLNTRDANNRARANHTGTQTASTISDFDSAARAQVEAELVAGTNITITPSGSGATRQLTIAASGGGGGSYTFDNGLNEVGGLVKIGSTLTEDTTISQGGFAFEVSESAAHGLFISPPGGANELKSDTNASVVADAVAKIQGVTGVQVVTPAIIATTATVGQVPVLVDAGTGEVEYQTISGGGGVVVNSIEVDFGTTPTRSKRFTITAAGVTPTSKILAYGDSSPATGRVGNDWEWDSINFTALAGTGQFTLTGFASGRIKGKRKLFYSTA